ncbi:hypothetical protein HYU90_01400 [Candidatus Collierbacteria bacterium]|nr:hypothetical protein [Candidatus Collierbacteria bacterium]
MGGRAVIDGHGLYLYLKAEVPLLNLLPQRGVNVWASIEIVLGLSDDFTCWVVRELLVSTSPNRFLVLWGSDFLEHYGKRPGRNDADLSNPNKRLWTMTCAANLQAMLEAYDQLAKELGKPALFGH